MKDNRLKNIVKGGAEACTNESVQFSDMSTKIKLLVNLII